MRIDGAPGPEPVIDVEFIYQRLVGSELLTSTLGLEQGSAFLEVRWSTPAPARTSIWIDYNPRAHHHLRERHLRRPHHADDDGDRSAIAGRVRRHAIVARGSPSSPRIACPSESSEDHIEESVSTAGPSLNFDAALERYSFNWKTDRGWTGTCRQLTLRFLDRTTRTATFTFER